MEKRSKKSRSKKIIPLTKEETKVAKFLRFHVPTKEGKIAGSTVFYFNASEALNFFLKSKYSSTENGKRIAKPGEILIMNRHGASSFFEKLFEAGLIIRCEPVKKQRDHEKESKSHTDSHSSKKSRKLEKLKDEKENSPDEDEKRPSLVHRRKAQGENTTSSTTANESETLEDEEDEELEKQKKLKEKKKVKRKLKLDVNVLQYFKDGDELYFWNYDPLRIRTVLLGGLIVLAVIAGCLFPIWPYDVRFYISYVSQFSLILLGIVLAIYAVRFLLYLLVLAATWGRRNFWILPNLDEDCGFFESFQPLYSYEVRSSSGKGKGKKKEALSTSAPATAIKLEPANSSTATANIKASEDTQLTRKGEGKSAGSGGSNQNTEQNVQSEPEAQLKQEFELDAENGSLSGAAASEKGLPEAVGKENTKLLQINKSPEDQNKSRSKRKGDRGAETDSRKTNESLLEQSDPGSTADLTGGQKEARTLKQHEKLSKKKKRELKAQLELEQDLEVETLEQEEPTTATNEEAT